MYRLIEIHNFKNNQVLIIVRKDLFNIKIIKNWINLISYFYSIVLDIIKRNIYIKGQKKTRIITIYNHKPKKNKFGKA